MFHKKFAIWFLTAIWLVVAALFVLIRFEERRFYSNQLKYIQYSDNTQATYAAYHVTWYLLPRDNPFSGPIFSKYFFEQPIPSQDSIPVFPAPYSRFAFLLRGYKVGSKVTYISPQLDESQLPKDLIEATITNPPSSNRIDPRYECFTRPKKQNDTIYFRTMITDLDKRDNVLPEIIETALRYSPFRQYFFPSLTASPKSREVWLFLLITHHAKKIYESAPFDTSKMFIAFDSQHGAGDPAQNGIRYRVYMRYDRRPETMEKSLILDWKVGWELFVVYTLGLVMLLRGTTIRDAIVVWWKRRKHPTE